jgi:hypothetical protein
MASRCRDQSARRRGLNTSNHFDNLVRDLRAFHAAERYAVQHLCIVANDERSEEEFAGADAAHAAVLGAVKQTAAQLGQVYHEETI